MSEAPPDATLRDLPLDGRGPIYQQVYRALRGAVLDGRAPGGIRLPPTRTLAQELGVSRNTVVLAYEQLRAEGYAEGRVGAGTFVAAELPEVPAPRTPSAAPQRDTARAAAAPPTSSPKLRLSRYGRWIATQAPRAGHDLLPAPGEVPFDFRPCVPDLERLPSEPWRRTVSRRALRAPTETLDYTDPAGSPALRRELAAYLARARGVRTSAENVIVLGGVAQALDLAARLLVEPGDRVLIEDPAYQSACRAFEAARARLVPRPVDAEGMNLRGLQSDARLAYVTPSHQFPTGVVLSLPRRLELLAWARQSNALVIEDDYDSEFRYAGQAIDALKSLDGDERVLYLGTLSKTLYPGLRLAYAVLPDGLVDVFRSARWMADGGAPRLESDALAEFIASGDYERHVRRARTLYARSRAALIDALRETLGEEIAFEDPRAGLHLHVRVPPLPVGRTGALLSAARERGVLVVPVAPRSVATRRRPRKAAPVELVLGFTRVAPRSVQEGVRRLGEAIQASR